MRRKRRVLMASLLLLAACRSEPHYTTERLDHADGPPSVLLLPIDVELSEVAAGGLIEPKADWTETAERLMTDRVRAMMAERGGELVPYHAPEDDPARRRLHEQLFKLHDAVADSILAHQYEPPFKLPGKRSRLDWSLGPAVALLRHEFAADYALFVFFRDSYKTPERTAAMIVAAPLAFLGVGISGGAQIGVASLVDLRSGQVVWFNRMIRSWGELRTPEGAEESLATLLESFPR